MAATGTMRRTFVMSAALVLLVFVFAQLAQPKIKTALMQPQQWISLVAITTW
jgi:hypothetical protein